MQFLKNNKEIIESSIKSVCRAALVLALMSTTSVYAHFDQPSDGLDEKARIRGLWQSGTNNNRREALEILKKQASTGDYKVRAQYLKKLGEYLKDNPVEIHGAQDILVDQTEGDLVVTKLTPLSSFYNTTLQMIAQDPNKTSSERDFESLKLQIFYRELPQQLIEGSPETLDKGIKKSLLNLQTNRGLSTRLLYKVLYLRNFYTDIDPDELKGIAKKSKQEADSLTPSGENEEERDILYRFAARTYFRVAHDLTLKADINKMISRYQKAADLGYTPAKYMLASLYNDRSTSVYDPVKAYALYSEAMKEDPVLAVYNVAGFHELRALNKEAEEDIVYVEDRVSQGSSEGVFQTAREEGIAVQYQTREEALYVRQQALDAQQIEQEGAKAQLFEKFQEIDREKEALKVAKDTFETEIALQQEDLERQQTILTQQREELARQEEQGRVREEQLVSDQENLRQANEALRVREEEFIRLQQEHANEQAQLAQNQTTLAEKEGELAQREEGQQTRNNQITQREAELTADLEALEARQAALNEQAEVLNRQRTEQQALQQQIAQQQAALDQRRQALDTREATLTQRQTQLDQLQQSLTTKETTLATGQRELATKEATLSAKEARLETWKNDLTAQQAALDVEIAKPKSRARTGIKSEQYFRLKKLGVKNIILEPMTIKWKYYDGDKKIDQKQYEILVKKKFNKAKRVEVSRTPARYWVVVE